MPNGLTIKKKKKIAGGTWDSYAQKSREKAKTNESFTNQKFRYTKKRNLKKKGQNFSCKICLLQKLFSAINNSLLHLTLLCHSSLYKCEGYIFSR